MMELVRMTQVKSWSDSATLHLFGFVLFLSTYQDTAD